MNDEIAILNLSKRLKPEEVLTIADACARQLAEDVCPAWGVPNRPINVYSDVSQLPPETTDIIPIMDDAGDPGALGFHSMGIAPFGRVFVNPILDSGGCVLFDKFDPQRLSVASVVSHEAAIELPIDPGCDQYALDAAGNEIDLEAADPTQRSQYVKTAKMPWGNVEVSVSDFVFPDYFRVGSAGPWNYMHAVDGFAVKGPFTVFPGGYQMVNGQPVFARRGNGEAILPPAWWLAMRPPGGRSGRARRAKQFSKGTP